MRSMRFVSALLLAGLLVASPVRAEDPAPERIEPRLIATRTPEARKRNLQRYGGNTATEKAVQAALDWLARHQTESGLWDADGFEERCEADKTPCDGIGKGHHGEPVPCPFDVPISALATLAFLGQGHLPDAKDDPYAGVVEKALGALSGQGHTWGLALVTQAFAEAEAMEGKGRWREQVDAGVARLVAQRQKDGAWAYYPARPGSDVPYTALAVQALTAARDAGAAVPDDLASGVNGYLVQLEIDKGRLAYLKEGRKYGYTPTTCNAHLAAAIRHLLEVGTSSPAHRQHMGVLAKRRPKWKISFKVRNVPGRGKVKVQIGHLSMYQWWYGTIAAFQAGGSTWSAWFGKLKSALGSHQDRAGCRRGSWEPLGTYEGKVGGRVFSTALGALMLSEPSRHRRLSETR
jgi:hypothetical protein